MAEVTVRQLADVVGIPVDRLLVQLGEAGLPHTDVEATINDEDKALVENQRPEELPLDLTQEGHIPADRFSIAYRKALVEEFGLGAPLTA